MNKQFTKDMLVAGKHFVQTKDSEESLYLLANIGKDVMAFEVDGSTNPFCGVWFEDLKNDLTYPHNHDFDVLKVFEFEGSAKFGVSVESLKLIWQREEKSQSQIELEKLQKQIS